MPQVIAIGLGTMHTVFSGKQGVGSKNTGPMQTLAWLAKNNRPPAKQKRGLVEHPWHPTKKPRMLETSADAYVYAAEVYTNKLLRQRALEALGLTGWPIALVPVPASCTTRQSSPEERWPALALAKELATRGLGRVRRCVVNRKATKEQTISGERTPAHEIAANMERIAKPHDGEAVIFVDDVVTWGARLAAMNHVLAWKGPTAGLCVAFTNDGEVVDCYTPKKRVVAYDASSTPWTVTISKAHEAASMPVRGSRSR